MSRNLRVSSAEAFPSFSKTERVDDPHDLARFVEAQRDSYERALAELRGGKKRSHWMWYIFPQIAGLGHSTMSQLYAIQSLDEARAFLAHPVLGPRLIACTEAMNNLTGQSAREILGSPDDLKFQSCMTLFAAASPETSAFAEALDKYYDAPDARTLELLGS
jgi:uncharacterized protein (DUF1810 family)